MEKYTYSCENLHHIITFQFNSMMFIVRKINYFGLYLHAYNFSPSIQTSNESLHIDNISITALHCVYSYMTQIRDEIKFRSIVKKTLCNFFCSEQVLRLKSVVGRPRVIINNCARLLTTNLSGLEVICFD